MQNVNRGTIYEDGSTIRLTRVTLAKIQSTERYPFKRYPFRTGVPGFEIEI